jgi:valyl-tRNA synthetase
VYQFIWHEFCDWYIELVKPRLYDGTPEEKQTTARVLRDVLDGSLRLLHPFMPFVTEEIWQKLPRAPGDPASIMVADYPRPDPERLEDREAERFDTLVELVQAIRSLRVDLAIPESAEVEVYFDADPETSPWLQQRAGWLARLAKTRRFIPRSESWPAASPSALVRGVEIRLPLTDLAQREELLGKWRKDEEKITGDLRRLEGRLNNPGFLAKAPPDVVEKDRGVADELRARLAKLQENLQMLESAGEGS